MKGCLRRADDAHFINDGAPKSKLVLCLDSALARRSSVPIGRSLGLSHQLSWDNSVAGQLMSTRISGIDHGSVSFVQHANHSHDGGTLHKSDKDSMRLLKVHILHKRYVDHTGGRLVQPMPLAEGRPIWMLALQ